MLKKIIISPVICNHDTIRYPKNSQSFPSRMIIQNIFVCLIELANDIKDTLSNFWDQSPKIFDISQI